MLTEDNVRKGFVDDAMVAAIKGHLAPALQPIVTFAYVTGWRVQSEVLPLEWRQVDRTARTVRLDAGTTKNGKGRSLDFGDHAALGTLFDALWTQHKALAEKGAICPWIFQRNGHRVRDFRKAWETACRAAGFPGRIPHDLRRSAVRNLVRAGVPDTVAMTITGHQTRSVFDRYDISSEADVREGLARLEGATGTNRGDNRPHAKADATKHSA